MPDRPLTITKALIRSNYTLAPDHVAACRKSLARGLHRRQTLEDEISRLHHLSHELSLKKQALTTLVNSRMISLSSLNQVPFDVLEEIFSQCLPIAHNAIMSIHEPPLSLGLVCRRWRQIIYSTPKLWTSIHIVATPLSPPRDAARREALSSWLSRSGILPLSISIYMNDGGVRGPEMQRDHPVQRDIDIIAYYAHRWKSIRSKVHDFDWSRILTHLKSHDVPLLEHLQIDNLDPSPQSWEHSLVHEGVVVAALCRGSGIFQAPRLRTLALPGGLARQLVPLMHWERLTGLELRFQYMHGTNVFRILSQCENLIDATFVVATGLDPWDRLWFHAPTPPDFPPQFQLSLPRLQSLTFTVERHLGSGMVSRLLEFLSTPALRHFSYHRLKRGNIWHSKMPSPGFAAQTRFVRRLRSFLDRLVVPLLELDFGFYLIPEAMILDILRCVPGVKHLSLSGPIVSPRPPSNMEPHESATRFPEPHPLSDYLLQHFIPGFNGGSLVAGDQHGSDFSDPLCPNIEILSFSRASFSHEAIIQLLRSRSICHLENGVTRLRKLNIDFTHTQPERLKEREQQDQLLRLLERETRSQVFMNYPMPSFDNCSVPLPTSSRRTMVPL